MKKNQITNDDRNQDRDMSTHPNQNLRNNPGDKSHPDGVMMQNGEILKVRNGQLTILEQDLTLSNGTKIMRDGTYIKKDGTKTRLKEGQHLDMSGNTIPMSTYQDRDTDKDRDTYLDPDDRNKEKYY